MGCLICPSLIDPEEKPVRLMPDDFDPEYTVHTAFPEEFAVKASSEEKEILSMIVGGHSDGIVWLCSKPSIDEAMQKGFTKGKVHVIGTRMNPVQCSLGYACCKGVKQETQSNQDSWLILKAEGLSIYGVFNGKVSNFAKGAMPRLIIESQPFCSSAFRSKRSMIAMLTSVFQRTHNTVAAATGMSKLDLHLTGTTCIIIVHDHGNNRLYVASTGDRGVCIASSSGTAPDSGLVASAMTRYQSQFVGEEKAYISKVNGEARDDGNVKLVNDKTVHYPSWSTTTPMGDFLGQMDAGLTAGPTVSVFDLKAEKSVGLILLVFSDGVWENISQTDALKIVARHPRSDAKGAAEKIAKIAWDKWKNREDERNADDIVALVIHLTPYGLIAL